MVQEFLPLCDVMFNIISLAFYFCDVVFDVVTVYTLYIQNQSEWFFVALSCIVFSLTISQFCSIFWYLRSIWSGKQKTGCLTVLICIHVLQVGVLLRYFRLFIPVDRRHVKNDIRDLCLLRLIHAFCEAAPMLLLQLYLIWQKPAFSYVSDLNIVSTVFSLISVCWALAAFNKNVRSHNVHRLVLTWLGVIFQLFWRLGTVTSRVLALTAYATVYRYWVLLVIALHWISMLLWLISPKNVFHGEKMPAIKKFGLSCLIASCYVFCYINLQEINTRRRMLAFYITMVLENILLVSVWLGGLTDSPWYKNGILIVMPASFVIGIVFMYIYYTQFHVRKQLKHSYQPQEMDKLYSSCTGCQMGECMIKSHRMPYPHFLNEISSTQNGGQTFYHAKLPSFVSKNIQSEPLYPYSSSINVPGVFNCRFNKVIKRKRKKPTTFVPTPVTSTANLPNNATSGRAITPFWKKPLPITNSSDHEGSIGSRVNIQQKLQEKKQQQMAELRKIEEEIRAGKLKPPQLSDISENNTIRQPIPRTKKQPWVRSEQPQYSYVVAKQATPAHRKPRSQTPEILLAPHYLENSRIYYEYQDPRWKYGNNYHLPSDDMSGSSFSKQSLKKKKKMDKNGEKRDKGMYKSYRISSDLDSQISLPRSYTLPREFKYYRRPKSRKMLRVDHFLASNNSSDGDVDSFDENEPSIQYRNGDADSFDENEQPVGVKSNGALVHPGHSHHPHHHFHYHKVMTPKESRDRAQPPTASRIHGLHRNTHETKL